MGWKFSQMINICTDLKSYIYYFAKTSTWSHNLPSLFTTNINWSNERKWFHTKKKVRIRQYPAERIMDSDYNSDQPILANMTARSKSQPAARVISHYMNSEKTEFIWFNQDAAIFSLNDKPLKWQVYIPW